jgi:hypothetical protein
MRSPKSALCFGTVSLLSEQASAEMIIKDTSSHERHSRIDFTGQLDPIFTFEAGLGGWFYMPIVPNGFIPSLNDTFGLEFGMLLLYSSTDYYAYRHTWWNVVPMGGVRWDFHLTPMITTFAKVKLGWGIGFAEHAKRDGFDDISVPGSVSYFAHDVGVGAYFNLSERFAFRVETGTASLIAAGVSIGL